MDHRRDTGRMQLDPVDDFASVAARNNADWCDLVARSHGVGGTVDADAWTSSVRTPPLYPDAVTLVRNVDAGSLLARVDATGGCSIKDSFAELDLAPHGFDVLFDAEWVSRAPAVLNPVQDSTLVWSAVTDGVTFDEWERGWRAADGSPPVLLASLVEDCAVTIVGGARDGVIAAGAVLNHGHGVVGLSNVFSDLGDLGDLGGDAEVWTTVTDWIATTFPNQPIVGYESGRDLGAARRAGFATVGPLRVWLKRT